MIRNVIACEYTEFIICRHMSFVWRLPKRVMQRAVKAIKLFV